MGKLKLKDCAETKTIKGVYNILKNDPVLKAVVKYWDFWDGSTQEKNVLQLPWIGVYPGTDGETDQIGYTIAQSTFPIDIEVAVDGNDCTDVLNLWNAVRLALNMDALKSLARPVEDSDNWHVNSSSLTKPAYGEGEIDDAKCLIAKGRLTVDLHIRTIRK